MNEKTNFFCKGMMDVKGKLGKELRHWFIKFIL